MGTDIINERKRPEIPSYYETTQALSPSCPIGRHTRSWRNTQMCAIKRVCIPLLTKLSQEGATILIPPITLFDRPEHGSLKLLERHVVGIAHGLKSFVQVAY